MEGRDEKNAFVIVVVVVKEEEEDFVAAERSVKVAVLATSICNDLVVTDIEMILLLSIGDGYPNQNPMSSLEYLRTVDAVLSNKQDKGRDGTEWDGTGWW
jgi:hypothetical protein